jgi:molybdopterin synthase catalytic subunit
MSNPNVIVDIVNKDLSLDQYLSALKDPTSGAMVTFSGMTRNYFGDKKVITLEYECYKEMALKTLNDIANECINLGALKVCLVHREGRVNITETSVICIIYSCHRAKAFEICDYSINEIKKRVPIWKKEIYENNNSMWKENSISTSEI